MEPSETRPSVKVSENGTMSISTPAGDAIEIGETGTASINLKKITAVGIYNLADVENHTINTIVGSVSHYVRFTGGGEVRFVYNTSGQLIELSAKNVITSVTHNNEIIFMRKVK